MARAFPEAEVIGVDLAPVPIDPTDTPPNCRFEIDDINLGLEHFENSFDVVHMRMVGFGIHDFRKTMDDGHRCLKPGGIALWVEVDYDIYAEDLNSHIPFALEEDEGNPDQTERSWFQRITYGKNALISLSIYSQYNIETRKSVRMGKCDLDGGSKAMDEGLWENSLMDPETCRTASLYVPIGLYSL